MSDLDRAYVINGDDLRIALERMNGRVTPRAAAAKFLEENGRPLEDARPVTVEALAAWFRDHKIHTDGTYAAYAFNPEALAELILEDLTGKPHPMPVEAEIEDGDADDKAIRAFKTTLTGMNYDAAKRVLAYIAAWHADYVEVPF